jgi:hypothetical protein
MYLLDLSTLTLPRKLQPFTSPRPILDVAFSPVVASSTGKKGGLCAILAEGGDVALLGLDSPDR